MAIADHRTPRRISRGRAAATSAGLAAIALIVGCATGPAATATDAPSASTTQPTAPAAKGVKGVKPVGEPTVIARNLAAPWSMLRLPGGSTLISQRDDGKILELEANGDIRTVTTVAGVDHESEGGLLGLTSYVDGDQTWIYAYFTSSKDNRIVRYPLSGDPGSYTLGQRQTITKGLNKEVNHNGGRIKFGPDGKLYATVGDAAVPDRAQNVGSRSGKILRFTPTGGIPAGNPFKNSPVFTLGHRNPQGIAWDDDGKMFAAEFGQNTWDEFNRIIKGKNYGWPIVEGMGDVAGYKDPLAQWHTDDASPSGLAYVRGTFFLAALGGERLWAIHVGAVKVTSTSYFVGDYGRLRDVTAGPDGTLWILTNNTDGRGTPGANDDRILQFDLQDL